MSDPVAKQADNKFKSFFAKIGKKIKEFFIKLGRGFVTIGKWFKLLFTEPKQAFKQLGDGIKRIFKWLRKQNGWLFLIPAVSLMCIFTFYPIVNSLIRAFQENYNRLAGTYSGIGFGNFKAVIEGGIGSGAEFMVCLKNTLILAFISVPLSIAIALLISVALNSIKALQKAYQTIFFLPYLTNALAMGAVFATFFQIVGANPSDPSTYITPGLVNTVLSWFGIQPVNWMNMGSSTAANYFVIIVYSTWSGLPFKILILFSALQNVGKQYYDAAKIDGANKSTILTKITVPLISPMISYLLITGIMGALKSYSSIVGIFGPNMGPFNDYEMGTMVGYIYSMIENNQMGYAAAGSLILFAIILVFTIINNAVSKKRVHY